MKIEIDKELVDATTIAGLVLAAAGAGLIAGFLFTKLVFGW